MLSYQFKKNSHELQKIAPAGITLDGKYLPSPPDGDGELWVRITGLIQCEPMELYQLWRNLEAAPTWQEQIAEVRLTSETTSHWVMQSGNKTIEWDSEILVDEPGKRIAWRSISGDSDNAGDVVFDLAPGGQGTLVTVLQQFRTGRNPKQAVIENLRHLKALAETGEIPRTQGQPHGPRGVIGSIKESMYGEKIATPPERDRKVG